MRNISSFNVLLILFILFGYGVIVEHTTGEDHVVIVPEKVYPGDAFILKVFSNVTPRLHFRGRELLTYKKNKYYQALGFVDIDTIPGVEHITIIGINDIKVKPLSIPNKRFPVKNITLKSDKVFLSPEDERRADKEERILESIWNTITPVPYWNGNFIRPVDGKVTSEFGVKRIVNQKKNSQHRGTDYKGNTSTPVKSINNGKVVLRDDHFYGGNTIVINHGLGLYSVYLHLSKFSVEMGDMVNKGDILGLVGSTGRASGPHLHLSIKLYGQSVNPESIFRLDL